MKGVQEKAEMCGYPPFRTLRSVDFVILFFSFTIFSVFFFLSVFLGLNL